MADLSFFLSQQLAKSILEHFLPSLALEQLLVNLGGLMACIHAHHLRVYFQHATPHRKPTAGWI